VIRAFHIRRIRVAQGGRMLLQQTVPGQITLTIGWVDLLIVVLLIFVFFRSRTLFVPVLLFIAALYIIRIFPNEILWLVDQINQLNGPAAFITISR
jgi:hypothetical protein